MPIPTPNSAPPRSGSSRHSERPQSEIAHPASATAAGWASCSGTSRPSVPMASRGGGQSGTRPVMPMRNAPENGEKAGGKQRRCEARGIVPGQQPTQQLAAQGGGPVI
jgi:hypothetical protein